MNETSLIDALLGTAGDGGKPDDQASHQHSNIITPTLRREAPKRRFERIGREEACALQIGSLPEPGQEIIMLMSGNWHGFDLVTSILNLAHPATIRHLYVASLGFNRVQAQHLARLFDQGLVESIAMVFSEIFSEKSNGEYAQLVGLMQARGQKVSASRNHAKIITTELSDGRKFVCHGSLNLRRCNAIEQVALSADADLYRFFTDYIKEQTQCPKQPI